MPDWSIARSWPIEPPTGRPDYDAAYIVRLRDAGDSTHDLVVEFAAPSALASVGYAEEVARRFLKESDPPSHVVVDVRRAVRVVADDTQSST